MFDVSANENVSVFRRRTGERTRIKGYKWERIEKDGILYYLVKKKVMWFYTTIERHASYYAAIKRMEELASEQK